MARLSNVAKMAARISAQQLYEDLRGKIVRGELRPGEAISETNTANAYGVSRTPIREVFWRLGEDGLLRVVPQVGTFVAPIRIASVRDSQFVRETLECRVVEEAAGKASEADVAALQAHLAEQRQAIANGDHIAFFASDEALHRQIMAITDRPFVWQIIASAKSQLDRVRFISLEDAGWLEQMFSQHEAIVRHIARHEPEAARRVMQSHLRSAFAAIDRIAQEHSDFFEGLDDDVTAETAPRRTD